MLTALLLSPSQSDAFAQFRPFFADAVAHMMEHGTTIKLEPASKLGDEMSGQYAAGGDDTADGGEFQCACGSDFDQWGEIFVHEYAHFLQQLDEDAGLDVAYDPLSGAMCERMWAGFDDEDQSYRARLGRFFDTIRGEGPLRGVAFVAALDQTRDMEADCDRRALTMIIARDLPFDRTRYAQRANAYHLFYAVMAVTRRWYDDEPPYLVDAIVSQMPTTIERVELTPGLMGLYRGYCYED